jgi:hypothetical protein
MVLSTLPSRAIIGHISPKHHCWMLPTMDQLPILQLPAMR